MKKPTAYDCKGKYAFVSYSHKDSRTVYSIIEKLAGMGYNIWYDEGLPLAADYGGVLYERIKGCSAFILFVSRTSVKSEDVEKEAANAISLKKPIVQIVIDEKAELPPSIAYHLPKTKQHLSIKSEPKEFYGKLAEAIASCKGNTAEGSAATPTGQMLSVGDKIKFGRYNQNSTATEPIEWRVLAVESDRALVISEYAIDCRQFDGKWLTGTKWEACTLRKWLNEQFALRAFTEDEYQKILSVKIKHPNNPEFDTIGGFSTEDRMFCLSAEEAELYFKSNEDRTAFSTGFANSQGAVKGACSWWLRTPGKTGSSAMYVDVKGKPVTFGMSVENNHVAVRPAFYIEL